MEHPTTPFPNGKSVPQVQGKGSPAGGLIQIVLPCLVTARGLVLGWVLTHFQVDVHMSPHSGLSAACTLALVGGMALLHGLPMEPFERLRALDERSLDALLNAAGFKIGMAEMMKVALKDPASASWTSFASNLGVMPESLLFQDYQQRIVKALNDPHANPVMDMPGSQIHSAIAQGGPEFRQVQGSAAILSPEPAAIDPADMAAKAAEFVRALVRRLMVLALPPSSGRIIEIPNPRFRLEEPAPSADRPRVEPEQRTTETLPSNGIVYDLPGVSGETELRPEARNGVVNLPVAAQITNGPAILQDSPATSGRVYRELPDDASDMPPDFWVNGGEKEFTSTLFKARRNEILGRGDDLRQVQIETANELITLFRALKESGKSRYPAEVLRDAQQSGTVFAFIRKAEEARNGFLWLRAKGYPVEERKNQWRVTRGESENGAREMKANGDQNGAGPRPIPDTASPVSPSRPQEISNRGEPHQIDLSTNERIELARLKAKRASADEGAPSEEVDSDFPAPQRRVASLEARESPLPSIGLEELQFLLLAANLLPETAVLVVNLFVHMPPGALIETLVAAYINMEHEEHTPRPWIAQKLREILLSWDSRKILLDESA